MPAEQYGPGTLDTFGPKVSAWATVLVSPTWWRLSPEDREAHRSGVELARWTNRQVPKSGLCTACWFRESEPDILFCDGGECRNFGLLLESLV
jgi:hypothetical protein